MGQTQAKAAEGEEERSLEAVEQLLAQKSIPRNVLDQVRDFFQEDGIQDNKLSLQGFQVNQRVAEYAAEILRLASTRAKTISGLSLEREIQDQAAIDILADFLLNQQPQSGHCDSLTMSFCCFGSSSEARGNCSALLKAKQNWRSLDFQHCNFVSEEENAQMSYLNLGLAAQTELEEFKFSHGYLSEVPPVSDAELAEMVNILASKNRTLRTLVMRDRSEWGNVQGRNTGYALVNLVETCRLEKLVWDIPCTHELYKDGSEMQQRFLAALENNETLTTVQLRRVSIASPLSKKIQACVQRNENIRKVRQTYFGNGAPTTSCPSSAVSGLVLGKLAAKSPRRERENGERRRTVRFANQPTCLVFEVSEPVDKMTARTCGFVDTAVTRTKVEPFVHPSASAVFLALEQLLENHNLKQK